MCGFQIWKLAAHADEHRELADVGAALEARRHDDAADWVVRDVDRAGEQSRLQVELGEAGRDYRQGACRRCSCSVAE